MLLSKRCLAATSLILLLVGMAHVSVAQPASFDEQVTRAYIAFYGRPADPDGLVFWSDALGASNGDLAEILDDFSNSDEFQSRYGSLSNEDLLSGLYMQLFSREPDPEGLAFYLSALESGSLDFTSIALDILNGAQNEDLDIVEAKQAVAEAFTHAVAFSDFVYSGDAAADTAASFLSEIDLSDLDSNPAEVSELIDNFLNGGEAVTLTILHMNDHHSHLEEDGFDYDVSGLPLTETKEDGSAIKEVEVTYGGFPRLTSLFNELEAESYNTALRLYSGDAITGTIFYTLFGGEADAALMNEICFDAFALGRHDFADGDAGVADFLDFLNSSSCVTPALAANVVPGPDSAIAEGYIQPYTVVTTEEGERIGIIGIVVAGKIKSSSNPDEDTEFLDEIETTQAAADELTAMGINKIILMSHIQYANDLELAAAVTGVDVIVGGDSHTLLGDNTLTDLGFTVGGDYPTLVTNPDGNTVCVVQAWEHAHLLGRLDVTFDSNGEVEDCQGEPILPIADTFVYEYNDDEARVLGSADALTVMDSLVAEDEVRGAMEDATASALLEGFASQADGLRQTVIGSVAEDLCLERYPGEGRSTACDASETYSRGGDIPNIVAKAFMTITPTADIAIQNAGGVRTDVKSGDFTIDNAYTLLPFFNGLVTLEMTGAEIVTVLEDALSNTLDDEGSSGSYPYASGLRFDVDASQAEGSRVSNVEVNSRVAGDWTAIDTSAVYTVVTNDFIASGGDGYDTFGSIFGAGNFVDAFTEYAQGMVEYIEQLTANGEALMKLPEDEYSTKSYIGSDGCDHCRQSDCDGF